MACHKTASCNVTRTGMYWILHLCQICSRCQVQQNVYIWTRVAQCFFFCDKTSLRDYKFMKWHCVFLLLGSVSRCSICHRRAMSPTTQGHIQEVLNLHALCSSHRLQSWLPTKMTHSCRPPHRGGLFPELALLRGWSSSWGTLQGSTPFGNHLEVQHHRGYEGGRQEQTRANAVETFKGCRSQTSGLYESIPGPGTKFLSLRLCVCARMCSYVCSLVRVEINKLLDKERGSGINSLF